MNSPESSKNQRGIAAHISLLADAQSARIVKRHASSVVVESDDDDACLMAAADALKDSSWRLWLTHRLPMFTRRLADQVRHRLALLKRTRADILILELGADDSPQDLKSGHAMQILQELRQQGIAGRLGLSHPDVAALGWFVGRMPIQALRVPYGLSDQSAAYRLIPQAIEHELTCIAQTALTKTDERSLSFLLADHRLTQAVLPVLKYPWEVLPEPMTGDEAEAAWQDWQATHSPPPMPESSAVPDGIG